MAAFGFDFYEPNVSIGQDINSCGSSTCIDSTFSVELFSVSTLVGSTSFNAPDAIHAFFGVSSTLPFDRVVIREIVGGTENEYYGQFYTSAEVGAVPIPAAIWLFGSGLLGLIGIARRKKVA